MKIDSDQNIPKKDQNIQTDISPKLPSINIQENQLKQIQNPQLKKDPELKLEKEKSISSIKLKITEHEEIQSKENLPELPITSEEPLPENEALLFPNDFSSEESKKSEPKIIEGKTVITINEILGEEIEQPLNLSMIDDNSIALPVSKVSQKTFRHIHSYAANTFKGIVRDYNEDRVSIILNMNKPKFLEYNGPWPKIAYFGVFDGHAGNKCAEFLRDNLLNYIIKNNYFPKDIPNAIKYGFKKIDEDYLIKHAFINNKLEDNSGSCALILLLVNNLIYIANVGDSRCVGSFKNGKIRKDITLDHKPNYPYEKERIIKKGGRIYQTQTPIEDDENFKDKILVGPYRVFPGKLSVSRTIGDAEGKIEVLGGNPNVLIPEPDIFTFDLEKDDIDFFILGCDGIYDQLSSKEILECAWMVINNNLNLFKKKLEGKEEKNSFKGNYGNEINMNTTSGNIVDMILKASMIRKSFDNVTCLIVSFKNFFENSKNEFENLIHKSKEIILRNKSNIDNINKIENELFPEKNNININLRSIKVEKDEELYSKNNLNLKRIHSPFLNGKKAIRINSLPKQDFSNLNNINNKNKLEDNIVNISTSQNKNMTVNNIITYNNNIILNSDNSNTNINNNLKNIHSNYKVRGNLFNEKIINNQHNINIINTPILKGSINKNNNNILINTSNNIFFTKMRITGVIPKKNKKELSVNSNHNQINRINIDNNINEETHNRNSSYNKSSRPVLIDNKNDIKDFPSKEKIIIAVPNNFNKNPYINKQLNLKKLNEEEYNMAYGNKKGREINLINNIRNNNNNNHINQDLNILNMKPLVLKTDKFQQQNNNNINITSKNFGTSKLGNKGIKFNNIIKINTFGINNYKVKNLQNININLKNIKLKKLKPDEIKIRKPMPTLTGNVTLAKKNKIFEENNFVKQRRFITNDDVGRRSNMSEHRKNLNTNNKMELNLIKKNTSEFDKKLLIVNNIK